MKISPISQNNTYTYSKQSFKANFPRDEVKRLIVESANNQHGIGLPQLYTLLEFVNKLQGKVAGIDSCKKGIKRTPLFLRIDNSTQGHSMKNNKLDALKDICIENDSIGLNYANFARMPEQDFEASVLKNKNVKETDVLNMSI